MQKDGASALRRFLGFARDSLEYLRFRHTRCRGVYGSVDEAQASISAAHKRNQGRAWLAAYNEAELTRLESGDFPLIFFLERTLKEGDTVLDIGGNVGLHYLRCRKYLSRNSVRWIALDTPEVVAAGRKVCARMPEVEFIDDIAKVKGTQIDFFFGCGCFQYIGLPSDVLHALASGGTRWPPYALIDAISLYDGPDFVTIQNVQGVSCPHRVFNRARLEREMHALGYEVRESWSNENTRSVIPFHRDRSVDRMSGYFFARPAS